MLLVLGWHLEKSVILEFLIPSSVKDKEHMRICEFDMKTSNQTKDHVLFAVTNVFDE